MNQFDLATPFGSRQQKNLVVWTLNRVSKWPEDVLLSALRRGGNRVVMGERAFPGVDPDHARVLRRHGTLMCEEHDFDEYFVPIPVKCIGDPASFQRLVGDGDKREAFRGLIERSLYADQYFRSETVPHYWKHYWPGHSHASRDTQFSQVRMAAASGDFRGYYELMRDFGRQLPVPENGRPWRHVLIGYSQGGLVARYLAYIDEYFAESSIIEGVISVQSPNHGSPLGRPENAKNIATRIYMTAAGLSNLDISPASHLTRRLTELVVPETGPNIDQIIGILDAAIRDSEGKKDRRRDWLKDARKWLSGLGPDPDSWAFADLNIERIDKEHSVLYAVNRRPPKAIYNGAVVSQNGNFNDLIASFLRRAILDGSFVPIASLMTTAAGLLFYQVIQAVACQATCRGVLFHGLAIAFGLMALAGTLSFGWHYFKKRFPRGYRRITRWLLKVRIHPGQPASWLSKRLVRFIPGLSLNAASEAYAGAMQEIGFDRDSRLPAEARQFPDTAHDFIIPSGYQMLPDNHASPYFLGHRFTVGAGHLSGADADDLSAGWQNLRHVYRWLRKIARG